LTAAPLIQNIYNQHFKPNLTHNGQVAPETTQNPKKVTKTPAKVRLQLAAATPASDIAGQKIAFNPLNEK